jgi:RNA polymerase sigma-70 factor (ECF subfamily)
MLPTDDQLVDAYLKQGDTQAFRQLVERHQERIYSYLLGWVRDPEVANDLFQETFLRVLAALRQERASYTQQGRWLAWVMRIARNAALDYLRSRRKWHDVVGNELEEDLTFWDQLSDEAPAPDRELEQAELQALLAECIERLPPEQREVLLLRQDAELTFREIADLTGVSINTALGRMRYALLNLRKMMLQRQKQPAIE